VSVSGRQGAVLRLEAADSALEEIFRPQTRKRSRIGRHRDFIQRCRDLNPPLFQISFAPDASRTFARRQVPKEREHGWSVTGLCRRLRHRVSDNKRAASASVSWLSNLRLTPRRAERASEPSRSSTRARPRRV